MPAPGFLKDKGSSAFTDLYVRWLLNQIHPRELGRPFGLDRSAGGIQTLRVEPCPKMNGNHRFLDGMLVRIWQVCTYWRHLKATESKVVPDPAHRMRGIGSIRAGNAESVWVVLLGLRGRAEHGGMATTRMPRADSRPTGHLA